ncbi:hypothetical protein [Nocardia blacklockiae]|uniref:hypothetical protein n=1 Tax=Nocardia blacklockiae TaxID=480036 RepID=UPI001E5960C1|nr:hypothetical protein [Nocardia blacklockiae]
MEVVERLVELVSPNTSLIKVEGFVEGLVHEAAGVVGRALVEPVGVSDEFERRLDDFDAGCEFGRGAEKTGLDAMAFHLDLAEACLDLGLRKFAVGSEVEQALFLDVQFFESFVQSGVHGTDTALAVGHGLIEHAGDVSDELLWQGEGLVVVDDGGLDLFSGQVRQVAYAVLAAPAQEVVVDAATPPPGLGVDEAASALVALTTVAE